MKAMLLNATLTLTLSVLAPASLSAGVIDARTNIFVAGQDSTGINTMGGLFPVVIQTFVPGAGQSVQFSVTGNVVPLTCGASSPCTNAGAGDGAALTFLSGPTTGTNIAPLGTNGISGIIFTGREMGLVGVFLDNNTPIGVGPSTPTFVSSGGTLNADSDTTFPAFLLGQVFWIGDGRTGFNNLVGAIQTWQVPSTATRLYVGFADAVLNFTGPWGGFDNNTGALNVSVTVISSVPEPGSIWLMGLGLGGVALLRKRLI